MLIAVAPTSCVAGPMSIRADSTTNRGAGDGVVVVACAVGGVETTNAGRGAPVVAGGGATCGPRSEDWATFSRASGAPEVRAGSGAARSVIAARDATVVVGRPPADAEEATGGAGGPIST